LTGESANAQQLGIAAAPSLKDLELSKRFRQFTPGTLLVNGADRLRSEMPRLVEPPSSAAGGQINRTWKERK
jgi:hypothetical protein